MVLVVRRIEVLFAASYAVINLVLAVKRVYIPGDLGGEYNGDL